MTICLACFAARNCWGTQSIWCVKSYEKSKIIPFLIQLYEHISISFINWFTKSEIDEVIVFFVEVGTFTCSLFFCTHPLCVLLNCSCLSIAKLLVKSFVSISFVTSSVISIKPLISTVFIIECRDLIFCNLSNFLWGLIQIAHRHVPQSLTFGFMTKSGTYRVNVE